MFLQETSDTGKTFEEYREAIKTLKIKVKNLTSKNEEVRNKITEAKKPMDTHIYQQIMKNVF